MNAFMKTIKKLGALLVAAVLCFSATKGEAASTSTQTRIGVVNFKQCVERSKCGKQEQDSFEALKKQSEQVLQEKEKELHTLAAKLNDHDYLDGISADAEAELKHRFRTSSQELNQQQQQLYQTLSQANYKIIQKMTDNVNSAADEIAQVLDLDMIVNEDACFYYSQKLDVTDQIVAKMDAAFEKEQNQ